MLVCICTDEIGFCEKMIFYIFGECVVGQAKKLHQNISVFLLLQNSHVSSTLSVQICAKSARLSSAGVLTSTFLRSYITFSKS